MRGYRLYFVDAAGHFAGSSEFEEKHDRAAMAKAEQQRKGQCAELWEGGRQLWVFDGDPSPTNNPLSYAEN